MTGGTTAATAVAIKRRKIIKNFRQLGATSSYAAINPQDHQIRKSLIFDRLVSTGVLINAGNDLYYLDEKREQAVMQKRKGILMIVVAIAIVVLLIGLYAGK